jgi:uncharacterized protein HemX
MARWTYDRRWRGNNRKEEESSLKWLLLVAVGAGAFLWSKLKEESRARRKSEQRAEEANQQAAERQREAQHAHEEARELRHRVQRAELEANQQKQRAEAAEAEQSKPPPPATEPQPGFKKTGSDGASE